MKRSVLSYIKISKERKDKIIGCYIFPFLVPMCIALFGIFLMIISRYKKAEILSKRILESLKRRWL